MLSYEAHYSRLADPEPAYLCLASTGCFFTMYVTALSVVHGRCYMHEERHGCNCHALSANADML